MTYTLKIKIRPDYQIFLCVKINGDNVQHMEFFENPEPILEQARHYVDEERFFDLYDFFRKVHAYLTINGYVIGDCWIEKEATILKGFL